MTASGARAYNLAFVLDSGGCTPAWNGDAATRCPPIPRWPARSARCGPAAATYGVVRRVQRGGTGRHLRRRGRPRERVPAVISRYRLTRIDLDYEGDDLDANMAARFAAIRTLEQNHPRPEGVAHHPGDDGRLPGHRQGRRSGRPSRPAPGSTSSTSWRSTTVATPARWPPACRCRRHGGRPAAARCTARDDATAYAHLGLQS